MGREAEYNTIIIMSNGTFNESIPNIRITSGLFSVEISVLMTDGS
jgi:hypothetical protein